MSTIPSLLSEVDALRAYVVACIAVQQAEKHYQEIREDVRFAERQRQQAWHELKRLNPKTGCYVIDQQVLEISNGDYPEPKPLVQVVR